MEVKKTHFLVAPRLPRKAPGLSALEDSPHEANAAKRGTREAKEADEANACGHDCLPSSRQCRRHRGAEGRVENIKDAKHAVAPSGATDAANLTAHVSWTTHDVEIIRHHYTPKYRELPPGLRKKYQRTGQLPPGWQKKMQPFPVELERECAPLPAGYRRGVFDAHAVIYNSHGTIIDVTVLF